MLASQQEQLKNALVAYFGDASLADGMGELLALTQRNEERRRRYRDALQAWLGAAHNGNDNPIVEMLG